MTMGTPSIVLGKSQPAPDVFTGELMTCCCCFAVQRSDPKVESQWRALVLNGVTYYACPKEFPKDGSSKLAFERAYERVIKRALLMRQSGAKP